MDALDQLFANLFGGGAAGEQMFGTINLCCFRQNGRAPMFDQ